MTNTETDLELAYMSIDTLKSRIHNLELEIVELKRRNVMRITVDEKIVPTYSDDYDESTKTGIGGGSGY